MLREEFRDGDDGGGAGLGEKDFQSKALSAIQKVAAGQKEITDNIATIDAEGKKLAEDFTNATKKYDGLGADIQDVTKALGKLELKIANERRACHGSALERISGDPMQRLQVNAIVRGTINSKGGSVPMNEEQTKIFELYQKALTTGDSPGSTYHDDELSTSIYSLIAEYGVWSGFDVVPVGSKTTKLITDDTDPDAIWATEGAAPAEGAITGTSASVPIGKILVWLGVSTELLEDSEIDLVPHILRKFANAVAYRLDFSLLVANGGADGVDGGYNGIFDAGTAAVAASGNVSTATLDFEDYLNAMLAADASVLSRPSTGWICHPQMLIRSLKLKDADGRPLFQSSLEAPSPGALGSILGYPVTLAHAAPNTDDVSSDIMAFGDKMGAAVGIRRTFEFATSDQVFFTEDKVAFKGRARAAVKVRKATAFGVLTTAAS